jgi:hypothetical protein
MAMRRRKQSQHRQRLDPALRAVIARAAGKYGGRIGGPARALRMTPLERSIAAMRAVKARWAQTTVDERRAWARYLLAHQRRFWNGRTLPRKPVRVPMPKLTVAAPKPMPPQPTPQPTPPQPIPVIVIPRRGAAVMEMPMPGIRYDV